jgi:hypothetical protein
MDYPRANSPTRLREYVNHQRIRDVQEAMAIVHRAGRLDLAESLRAWAERLAEALAMDDSPPETWLG